jgi:hypothetical protein
MANKIYKHNGFTLRELLPAQVVAQLEALK